MIVLPPLCEVKQMTVTVEEMKSYLRVVSRMTML